MKYIMALVASAGWCLLSSTAWAAPDFATGPSCDGGRGASNDCAGGSCCERIAIPGGSFTDYSDAVQQFARRRGEVKVAAFHLDKYEATVGRFRAWVKAGMPTPKRGTILQRDLDGNSVRWGASAETAVQRGDRIVGWKRYDTYAALMFTSPKNNVNFYTAQAFCHWDGGRLPTEHEWKYVAVGGEENRRHPWGNQRPTFEHAVYNCGGDGNPSCGVQDLITVGSKPLGSGRWGHMDLAGSVFEWAVAHEGSSRPDGRTAKSRGGGFCYIGGDDHRAALGLQATTARADELSVISHTVGVRCAYDAK